LENLLHEIELSGGELVRPDGRCRIGGWSGANLESWVLERVVEAVIEGFLGCRLGGLEVLELGVRFCGLIVGVLQPERSNLSDDIDVDLAVEQREYE
jgi:hypothetical protein